MSDEFSRKSAVLRTAAVRTKVSDVLRRKAPGVWTITSQATVFEALHMMVEHGVGVLPVVDAKALVGIVSERDIARKLILGGMPPTSTSVVALMSNEVLTVTEDDTIERCMRLMTRHRVRHLPVLRNEALYGIVSIGDLVYETINLQQYALDELERYVSG